MLRSTGIFLQLSTLTNFDGTYENEFKTIKSLHDLPKEKRATLNELTKQLLHHFTDPQDKQKCAERSRNLREEGNLVYKSKSSKKDFELSECLLSACRLYTQAILAAENAKEELCLGYANRGMALQDFGYYEQAYDDCSCALEFGYPKHLQHKLIMRQAHCAWKLGNAKRLEEHICSLQEFPQLNATFSQQSDQLQQELQQLQVSTDEELCQPPNVPTKTHKILADADKGRHMVALNHIKKNDLIFTEQADCFVPIEQRLVCQACAASLLCAPIPCPNCRQHVVYCSRRCRQMHASIHKYECDAYRRDLFAILGISQLAMRLLLTYLPQWLRALKPLAKRNGAKLWQELMSLADEQKNCTDASQSIQSLCMISHLDKLNAEEFMYHTLSANLLQVYLHNCIDFYNDMLLSVSDISLGDWHVLVGALILRCSGQLLVNGHVGDAILPCDLPANEFALLQPDLWQRPYHLRLGCLHKLSNSTLISAINLPYLSLCNHSCAPSIRTHFDGCTVSNYAVRSIAPGEEIFNCYTMDCRHTMSMQRRQKLEDIYKFSCRCSKCQRTKPDEDYFAFHRYRCERCKKIFTPEPLPAQDNLDWWLQPEELGNICCTICLAPQETHWYYYFQSLLQQCQDPEERCELYRAFAALKDCLLDYNSLKLSLARQLIEGVFAVKNAGFPLSDMDYHELTNVIRWQLAGIAAQSGCNSMAYITQLTYYWDLLAWGKHKGECPQEMRKAIDCLAGETRRIFVNYYNDFIEQQYK